MMFKNKKLAVLFLSFIYICCISLSCSTTESQKNSGNITSKNTDWGYQSQLDLLLNASIPELNAVDENGNYQYTFPQHLPYAEQFTMKGPAADGIVFQNNLYISGFQDGSAEAFKASPNTTKLISETPFLHQNPSNETLRTIASVFPSTVPSWLEISSTERIQSTTQNYHGKAFVLKNLYSSDTLFESLLTTPINSQIIEVIDLYTDEVEQKIALPTEKDIQTIRYADRKGHSVMLFTSKTQPNDIHSMELTNTVIENTSLHFEQPILTWNFALNHLVVLLEDRTVESYVVMWNKGRVVFQKNRILPSFPYALSNPHIMANPARKSYVIWESAPNGNTWFLSDFMIQPAWVNMDTTCYAVVSPFVPEIPETDYFETSNFPICLQLSTGPKAWTYDLTDFHVFSKLNTEDSLATWGSLGLRSSSKVIYDLWFDYYSTKPMQDGRYVGEED